LKSKTTKIDMAKIILLIVMTLFFLLRGDVYAQTELRSLRQGNDDYRNARFNEAEINYRKSLEINPTNYRALYNLGNALYRQENFEEAARILNSISETEMSRKNKAKVFHNLGNAYLKSNKLNESIEAYKNALRLNPNDMDTKYNLTYALSQLQQQQENQQCENEQNDEQEDNQEQNQGQDENQQNEQNEQQQEQPQNEISREDAERILDALERQEQNIQDKLKKDQTPVRITIEKDW